MRSQLFDKTTSVNTSGTAEIFNSESQGIAVQDAIGIGLSVENTGSALTITVEIKAHPNGAWTNAGSIASSSTTNITNEFYRQVVSITSAGVVATNSVGFLSANLKFAYAVRIRGTAASGTNSVRVRGNVKIPQNNGFYREFPMQQFTMGAITTSPSSVQPFWVDVTEATHLSVYFTASGTGLPQTLAANTIPGLPATSGNLAAVRFYPGGPYSFYIDMANADGMGGARTALNIQSPTLSSDRKIQHRWIVESAAEFGFLWHMPTGATFDAYVSMNG